MSLLCLSLRLFATIVKFDIIVREIEASRKQATEKLLRKPRISRAIYLRFEILTQLSYESDRFPR